MWATPGRIIFPSSARRSWKTLEFPKRYASSYSERTSDPLVRFSAVNSIKQMDPYCSCGHTSRIVWRVQKIHKPWVFRGSRLAFRASIFRVTLVVKTFDWNVNLFRRDLHQPSESESIVGHSIQQDKARQCFEEHSLAMWPPFKQLRHGEWLHIKDSLLDIGSFRKFGQMCKPWTSQQGRRFTPLDCIASCDLVLWKIRFPFFSVTYSAVAFLILLDTPFSEVNPIQCPCLVGL